MIVDAFCGSACYPVRHAGIARPVMKYFGSKWKGCHYYPAPRYNDGQVLLVDIDPEVIAMWQWLIAADPRDILALPTRSLVEGQDLRALPFSRPACDLIRRWQRIGRCSSWTVSSWNGRPGMWGDDIRAHIAASLPAIRGWSALCGSYHDIPVDAIGSATWFIDPPYWVKPGDKPRRGYKYERIDYAHLAAWCRRLHGQVIVCEQDGAEWLPFHPSHDVTGIKRRVHHKHANGGLEMIWTNDA